MLGCWTADRGTGLDHATSPFRRQPGWNGLSPSISCTSSATIGNTAMIDNEADQPGRAVHSYACIRTGGGEYIIYEEENPTAWIQSDTTITTRG